MKTTLVLVLILASLAVVTAVDPSFVCAGSTLYVSMGGGDTWTINGYWFWNNPPVQPSISVTFKESGNNGVIGDGEECVSWQATDGTGWSTMTCRVPYRDHNFVFDADSYVTVRGFQYTCIATLQYQFPAWTSIDYGTAYMLGGSTGLLTITGNYLGSELASGHNSGWYSGSNVEGCYWSIPASWIYTWTPTQLVYIGIPPCVPDVCGPSFQNHHFCQFFLHWGGGPDYTTHTATSASNGVLWLTPHIDYVGPSTLSAFSTGQVTVHGGNLTNFELFNQNIEMKFCDASDTCYSFDWYGYVPDYLHTGWNDTNIIILNSPIGMTAPAYPDKLGPFRFRLCWGDNLGGEIQWCIDDRAGNTYFQCPQLYPQGCPP